jgi:hypothetical protein
MVYGAGETPLEVGEDGRVLIQREAAEVFRPETIASFEGKALTITHPADFVNPDNWSRLAKGILQNVRQGKGEFENDLIADILITDSVAINLVKSGLREVSCGYEAEYVQTGEGRGLQTNIVGNHLALVDDGRAGSKYAINDHKGAIMKFREKVKAIFGKAQDEAMKVLDEASEKEMPKKDDKAKDGEGDPTEVKAKDDMPMAGAYDELAKMVKDLGEKIAGMTPKSKDETKPATENSPAETDATDEEVAPGLEDRLKAVEAAVAKLLEQKAAASDEDGDDDDSEESEDADGDEEKSEDDDFEESTMVGDTASRIEILAPGLKVTGKDAKKKAVLAAYATKDGKKVIEQLTGGKAPVLDSAEKIETIFVAVSELLKVSRTSELAQTKQTRDFDSSSQPKGPMTPEQMNALNSKHYGKQ